MFEKYKNFSDFLFQDKRSALLWLAVRLYLGYTWLMAGMEKFFDPTWNNSANVGGAITGFLNMALKKTAGAHPDVSAWYAFFIQNVVLPHPVTFSYLVTFGEIAVGIGLITGLYTGLSAFFGAFMNFNYLFAGTISINPLMLLLEIPLVSAWRVAGWLGFDRFLLNKSDGQ